MKRRLTCFAIFLPMVACLMAAEPEIGGIVVALKGKTEVKIGEPQYTGMNPKVATVTLSLELDDTSKGFVDQSVTVTHLRLVLGNENVAYFNDLTAAPTFGGGPVTYDINFPVVSGEEYKIELTMRYKDGASAMQSVATTKTITP